VFRWLRELVSDGYVGEVLSTTVVASTAGWGAETSERMRYTLDRESGATMLSIAFGHAIDAVTMVVGELEEVMATTATRRPRVTLTGSGEKLLMTAEDQVAISGTFAGGGILSAHYRGGMVPGFWMRIDGTQGTLEVSAPTHPHIARVTVRAARGSEDLTELKQPDHYDADPGSAGTPEHTLAHAYSAIRDDLVHGTSIAPDFTHAVRRHRLLDAIARSAETGRRVQGLSHGW
jgi:predicted dehydrogenase